MQFLIFRGMSINTSKWTTVKYLKKLSVCGFVILLQTELVAFCSFNYHTIIIFAVSSLVYWYMSVVSRIILLKTSSIDIRYILYL